MDTLSVALTGALVAAILSTALLYRLWMSARSQLRGARFHGQSLSSKYGKMTEQFMPFMSDYPWEPQSFRFLGSPIDGVQFEDDKVIFVEFKTASSKLSARQRHIRDLIRDGRIEFREFRLE